MWSTIEDKPTFKRFTAISFEIKVTYFEDSNHWRISFDDAATSENKALGGIDTDAVETEFRSFIQELTEVHGT
jgi:hypothetical protein